MSPASPSISRAHIGRLQKEAKNSGGIFRCSEGLRQAYVNDIPRPSNGVQLALFADDTALYLRGSNFRDTTPRLRRAIDELIRWLRLWRIKCKVNPEKSAAIRFNYSKHKKKFTVPYNAPTLRIDNAQIPRQHNYKYLGVTLDKHLHFRDHVARVSKLTKFYQSRQFGKIGRKSKMSLRNKRTLYLMCIRPVMTNTCPVFARAAPNIIKKLQKIQNKFCRQATDAHWCVKNSVLHGDLELPTINKFMKDASKRFFDMAQNHPNPLIMSAATYEPPPAHHFLRRPRNILSDPPDALTSEVEKLADIGQSRAVSISMLPAAFDEDVKTYGITAKPFLCFFGGRGFSALGQSQTAARTVNIQCRTSAARSRRLPCIAFSLVHRLDVKRTLHPKS
ncbi:Probable RNA-directed DNA polymerase from transposon X-element [Eumeta japonica]|uniref:Probable RNA-directed DNA polymerase from transposon X-element n=1 Tax=Eumeta variegata TaxID=151549 RepID=A0A4C1U7S5_EUMVA|nr:Probable RNA-directed DNA polymerase from transposon X-element [Eumeta japonica]